MTFKLTHENKYYYFIALVIFSVFGYLLTNHFPLLTPTVLPLTRFDESVPFIAQTIWVYISMYPMMVICFFFLLADLEILKRALTGFFYLQVVSFLIFILFPTILPRESYPIGEHVDVYSRYVFEWLRMADKPHNCCPSLHVGNCFISSLYVYKIDKKKGILLLFWSAVVAVSTMTTKQHYFYDVSLGAVLASTCFFFTFKTESPSEPAQA